MLSVMFDGNTGRNFYSITVDYKCDSPHECSGKINKIAKDSKITIYVLVDEQ